MPSARNLPIGQDLVQDAMAVVGEDLLDGFGGLDGDGHGELLDHDLVGVGYVDDHACAHLVGQDRRAALPVPRPRLLVGGVDGDGDEVRLADVGAEEEVAAAAAALLGDVVKAGLVDGEPVAIAAGDPCLGDVY